MSTHQLSDLAIQATRQLRRLQTVWVLRDAAKRLSAIQSSLALDQPVADENSAQIAAAIFSVESAAAGLRRLIDGQGEAS